MRVIGIFTIDNIYLPRNIIQSMIFFVKYVRNTRTHFTFLCIISLLVLSTWISIIEGEPVSTPQSINSSSGATTRDTPTQYGFFNYDSMVDMLNGFEADYPNLVDLSTAQETYSLPDCQDGYKTFVLKISNESKVSAATPEVLFLGGIHGDEKISVSAAMYLAKFLVENYHDDEYIRYLVDNREIYIMPCLNPYGLENGQRTDGDGEDINRDFSFDKSGIPYTSVGARAVHELMREHLFISAVNWHSGTEAIGYAWGCEAHDTATDESPDDSAFYSQARGMRSFAGDFKGFYPTGRNNQVIYYARGAFSDYAYAASWDSENSDTDWPTGGCRALGYTVEISNSNDPEVGTLGTDEFIYYPGATGDGYIPKNIRLALYQIDTASPYVAEPAGYEPPEFGDPTGTTKVKWVVGGCERVDSAEIIASEIPDVINNTRWRSPILTGNSSWEEFESGGNPLTMKDFELELPIPPEPGTYYYQIRTSVDGHLTHQSNPTPFVSPQSLYAKMRTRDNEIIRNGASELHCSSNYYSEIYEVVVNSSVILDPLPDFIEAGASLEIGWQTSVKSVVNRSYIAWGETDPGISPDYIVNGTLIGDDRYEANIILPDRWGKFHFRAVAIDHEGNVFHSIVSTVSTWPSVEVTSLPNETLRGDTINISWSVLHANTVDSSYVFAAYSGDIWNDSLVSGGPFSGDRTDYTGTIKIPNATGLLRVGVSARVDSRPEVIYSKIETIRVLDFFSISGTTLHYTGEFTQTLDISNVTVSHSGLPLDLLGPQELSIYSYTIIDAWANDTNIAGNMSFDAVTSVWSAVGINVSYLIEGNYFVSLNFRYGSINISNLLDGDSSFNIDHTVSISNLNFTFRSNLALKLENLKIVSSNPSCSPLPLSCFVNSSLELFYDSNGTSVLNIFGIINYDPATQTWSSSEIDLGAAMPGKYYFILRVDTIFENTTIFGDRFSIVIPDLAGPAEISVSKLSYADGLVPILEIGGILIEFPDQISSGPYLDYLHNSRIVFILSSADYDESRTYYPVGFADPGEIDFNLSSLPSGTYQLSGYFSSKVVFPLGGSLVLDAAYIYPLPITVVHRYWFGDSVNVTVRQGKESVGFPSMDVGGIQLFSTWDHDFHKIITVRASVMREAEELFNTTLFFNEESGYWELFNMDISTLEPGEYKIRFHGQIDNLTFTSGKLLDNSSRFTINSEGLGEGISSYRIGLWMGVVVFTLIVIAIFAVLLHRRTNQNNIEKFEDPPLPRTNDEIPDLNNKKQEIEKQKRI